MGEERSLGGEEQEEMPLLPWELHAESWEQSSTCSPVGHSSHPCPLTGFSGLLPHMVPLTSGAFLCILLLLPLMLLPLVPTPSQPTGRFGPCLPGLLWPHPHRTRVPAYGLGAPIPLVSTLLSLCPRMLPPPSRTSSMLGGPSASLPIATPVSNTPSALVSSSLNRGAAGKQIN